MRHALEQFDLPLDFFEENIPMPKQTSDYITRSESISGLREEEVASVRHNSLQNCDSYLPGCGHRQPLSGRIARTTEEHEDDAFFMYKDTVTWPPQNNSGVTTSQYAIPTTINAQLSILDPFSVVFGPQLPQTPSQQTYLSSIPEDPFNLMLTHPTYRNPTQSKTLLDTTLHTGPPPAPATAQHPSLSLPSSPSSSTPITSSVRCLQTVRFCRHEDQDSQPDQQPETVANARDGRRGGGRRTAGEEAARRRGEAEEVTEWQEGEGGGDGGGNPEVETDCGEFRGRGGWGGWWWWLLRERSARCEWREIEIAGRCLRLMVVCGNTSAG